MKKLLTLFVILDLIFVGVILKVSSEKERSVASLPNEPELTDGQNQKLELISSLKFSHTSEKLALKTDLLQSICFSYSLIELKFKALNVAFSGQQPFISHTFSCAEIKKDTTQQSLITSVADFKSMQKNHLLKKEFSQLIAHGIYSDEELPNEWCLFEIVVSGETNFSISEAELNKILGQDVFKFNLTTF